MLKSELHIVVVSQLQLLTDVLLPGGVQSHVVWLELGFHGTLDNVSSGKGLLVEISFHSAAVTLEIFSVAQENLVDFSVLLGNDFPIVNHAK